MIRLMLGRVSFMRKLCKNEKPLKIWVWPTPWKKTLPKSGQFTEGDINSGSSTMWLLGPRANENGDICLWRKEEILKVLVHELVHAFRIDTKDPSPKEAYVELRAVWANLYLELLERQIPLSEYEKYLEHEKRFGVRQCRKIRAHDPGKTNIKAYLDERNRLLNKLSKAKWERLLKGGNPGKTRGGLRFTVAETLLAKVSPRKDLSGNVLDIP